MNSLKPPPLPSPDTLSKKRKPYILIIKCFDIRLPYSVDTDLKGLTFPVKVTPNPHLRHHIKFKTRHLVWVATYPRSDFAHEHKDK